MPAKRWFYWSSILTNFEELLAATDAETLALARRMVGQKEWALFIARTVAGRIGTTVDVDAVAEVFGLKVSG
jgi:hypothetical protein